MKTLPEKPESLDNTSKAIQIIYRLVREFPFIPSVDRYNITISHEKKFIWFRVAKSGTRTILSHLHESGVHLDVEHASFLHYPIKRYEDYFKFAFVRNPWDRLVSCWHNKVIDSNHFQFDSSEIESMKNFEDFVVYVSDLDIENCNRHLRLQSALIDLNNLDYLGRMETFGKDVKNIFQILDIDLNELKSENVTRNRKSYQEYYSKELAEKVYDIYRKDIQIFGYQF